VPSITRQCLKRGCCGKKDGGYSRAEFSNLDDTRETGEKGRCSPGVDGAGAIVSIAVRFAEACAHAGHDRDTTIMSDMRRQTHMARHRGTPHKSQTAPVRGPSRFWAQYRALLNDASRYLRYT